MRVRNILSIVGVLGGAEKSVEGPGQPCLGTWALACGQREATGNAMCMLVGVSCRGVLSYSWVESLMLIRFF